MDKCLGCEKPGAPSDAVCAGCAWRVPNVYELGANEDGCSGSGSGTSGSGAAIIAGHTVFTERWAPPERKGEQDGQLHAL